MKKNILLIDDNPDDLEFYTDLFKSASADYSVLTATNLEDALAIFKKNEIYCTFVDYYIPELNGLKVLETLMEHNKGKVLAGVILTGDPNQSIQAEAARRGALDYILKDVANTPEQIENVIKKTVSWAESLNEMHSKV